MDLIEYKREGQAFLFCVINFGGAVRMAMLIIVGAIRGLGDVCLICQKGINLCFVPQKLDFFIK